MNSQDTGKTKTPNRIQQNPVNIRTTKTPRVQSNGEIQPFETNVLSDNVPDNAYVL